MDSINIHSVFLIGTSLGGLLAMQLAVARPSVIKGIILNDIGPEFPIEGVNRISRLTGTNKFFKSWNDAALYLKETYTSAHPKISDEKWLELAKNTYTEKKGLIINNFDMNIISQMRYSSRSNNFWNLYDSIANIPTLLIRGSLSDILTKNITNKMLELKKDIKYLEVSLCGHCPFLDEKEVLQEIRNFLF